MKLLLTAVLAALACQLCSAKIELAADTEDLSKDSQDIVQGLIEVIQGVVQSKGDIASIQKLLADIKARIERKLAVRGPAYLHTLAQTLSAVDIDEETLDTIKSLVLDMAQKDGVKLRRARRSPWGKKKGKFGKMKMGKMKMGKMKMGKKMGKMKGKGCGK